MYDRSLDLFAPHRPPRVAGASIPHASLRPRPAQRQPGSGDGEIWSRDPTAWLSGARPTWMLRWRQRLVFYGPATASAGRGSATRGGSPRVEMMSRGALRLRRRGEPVAEAELSKRIVVGVGHRHDRGGAGGHCPSLAEDAGEPGRAGCRRAVAHRLLRDRLLGAPSGGSADDGTVSLRVRGAGLGHRVERSGFTRVTRDLAGGSLEPPRPGQRQGAPGAALSPALPARGRCGRRSAVRGKQRRRGAVLVGELATSTMVDPESEESLLAEVRAGDRPTAVSAVRLPRSSRAAAPRSEGAELHRAAARRRLWRCAPYEPPSGELSDGELSAAAAAARAAAPGPVPVRRRSRARTGASLRFAGLADRRRRPEP